MTLCGLTFIFQTLSKIQPISQIGSKIKRRLEEACAYMRVFNEFCKIQKAFKVRVE